MEKEERKPKWTHALASLSSERGQLLPVLPTTGPPPPSRPGHGPVSLPSPLSLGHRSVLDLPQPPGWSPCFKLAALEALSPPGSLTSPQPQVKWCCTSAAPLLKSSSSCQGHSQAPMGPVLALHASPSASLPPTSTPGPSVGPTSRPRDLPFHLQTATTNCSLSSSDFCSNATFLAKRSDCLI